MARRLLSAPAYAPSAVRDPRWEREGRRRGVRVELYQKHGIAGHVRCDWLAPNEDKGCTNRLVLEPPTDRRYDTLDLFTKKLAGKQASDLPIPVVQEYVKRTQRVDAKASLRVDDGSNAGPVVGQL